MEKNLSKKITLMRGQCWHEWVLNNKPCIYCHIGIIDISERPDYEHDANKYMMLFQELPSPKSISCNDTEYMVRYYNKPDIKNHINKEIGTAICLAWLEAFECKCGYSSNPIVRAECILCNGTGSTFKKEVADD